MALHSGFNKDNGTKEVQPQNTAAMHFDTEGKRMIVKSSLAPWTVSTKQKSVENRNVRNKFNGNNQESETEGESSKQEQEYQVRIIQ